MMKAELVLCMGVPENKRLDQIAVISRHEWDVAVIKGQLTSMTMPMQWHSDFGDYRGYVGICVYDC